MPSAKEKREVLLLFCGILLASLTVSTVSRLKRFLEQRELNSEQKVLAKRLLKKFKNAVVDKASGYISCGPRVKYILKEPLVKFNMCDKEDMYLKKSFVPRVKRANDAMKRATGKCIDISSTTRSNAYELKIEMKANKSAKLTLPRIICTSGHVIGQAFDVNNFEEATPFLEKEGFVGGFRGLFADPWHFCDAKRDIIKRGGWWREKKNKMWYKYYRKWKRRKFW